MNPHNLGNHKYNSKKSSYDYVAGEYYSKIHKTSRNFDAATYDFFKKNKIPLSIDKNDLVLELGSGTGRTIEYCKIDANKIIQTDVSKTMLLLQEREPCYQRIICDALKLPFRNSVFSIVTAFLYDPYNIHCLHNGLSIYCEISYTLKKGGIFLGTLPHIEWGSTLRQIRKQKDNEAKFFKTDESLAYLNSFLVDDESIKQALIDVGLNLIEMHDLKLPRYICEEDISRDIIDPAKALGIDQFCLPIVKVIIARK